MRTANTNEQFTSPFNYGVLQRICTPTCGAGRAPAPSKSPKKVRNGTSMCTDSIACTVVAPVTAHAHTCRGFRSCFRFSECKPMWAFPPPTGPSVPHPRLLTLGHSSSIGKTVVWHRSCMQSVLSESSETGIATSDLLSHGATSCPVKPGKAN